MDDELHPCIGICLNDPETGICEGCGRPSQPPAAPADQAAATGDIPADGANR
ncbi:MAG: DUF1289 domain-containing protein [Betaproteobacteria bacterium]